MKDWLQQDEGGLNWSLAHQQNYLVNRLENGAYNPIPDIFILSNYSRFIVGINCPLAYIEWRLGAWISVQSQFTNFASNFGDWVDIYKDILLIKKLMLIELETGMPPYRIHIKIPHWHEEVYLEVYEHS